MANDYKILEHAITALQKGGMIVVSDNEDRENEGDVIMAANKVTPQHINFMISHCKGLVCAPITEQLAKKLELPPIWLGEEKAKISTNFTVPIDHVSCRTGISAKERASTLLALVSPTATATNFHKPGHIFPIVAHKGGLQARQGHTEAAIALLEAAKLPLVGIICEIIGDDGEMLRGKELQKFAKKHNLHHLHINKLIKN